MSWKWIIQCVLIYVLGLLFIGAYREHGRYQLSPDSDYVIDTRTGRVFLKHPWDNPIPGSVDQLTLVTPEKGR